MAENTKISWCDHTFNPWIGCTEAGPGCDHCYAKKQGARLNVGWGDDAPRVRTSARTWAWPEHWNDTAVKFYQRNGRWPRIFSASLADIFDKRVPEHWRADFWEKVRVCTRLQWMIVTKRSGNVPKMLPEWIAKATNIVLIFTVCNQAEFDRDVPRLRALKKLYPWLRIGLSIEPQLGFIAGDVTGLDIVIGGGESEQMIGPRDLIPYHEEWAWWLRDHCERARVPFHFKQWGAHIPVEQATPAMLEDWRREHSSERNARDVPRVEHDGRFFYKLGTRLTGRKLDGAEHDGEPAQ